MKILQVGSHDLIGKRFNGQYIVENLPAVGHEGRHLVIHKEGINENTHVIFNHPLTRKLQRLFERVEARLSIRSLLHPFSFLLKYNSHFKQAEVVHYHIMYWPNAFSLLAYPGLTRRKPAVMTLHDFWSITGHCIYPFECNRWQTGCGKCPHLSTNFPMRRDHTSFMWKIKKFVFRHSKFDIVVASQFMKDRVEKSPLVNHFRIHHVPFGLDLNVFKPGDQKYSKRILGIEPDEVVISFRAAANDFKGFEYIKSALRSLKTDKKICLLTFDGKWMVEEFRTKFKILDLGWVHDDELTLHAYSASDIFLMPSIQESFGMMAMEAMAFGKPVIVFDGTSLPEIVGGKEIGVIVPSRDIQALCKVVDRLTNDETYRMEKGQAALKFAKENYSLDVHLSKMLKVYEKAINEF